MRAERAGHDRGPAAPSGIACSPTRAYVCNQLTGSVSIIDLASGTVVGTIAVGGVLLNIEVVGTRAYATGNGGLHIIDLTTDSVVATIPIVVAMMATSSDVVDR